MKRATASVVVLTLLCVGLSSRPASGQTPTLNSRLEADRVRREMSMERRRSEQVFRELDTARRNRSYLDRKMTAEQKKRIAVLPEDKETFASFLRQSNTGLVRLLPGGKYAPRQTVSVDELEDDSVLPIAGGGSFYSFTERTHEAGPWSEISLQGGQLAPGFMRGTLTLLTFLGDVPLDAVTPDSAGVQYLRDFVPPTTYPAALEQYKRNREGFRAGEFVYRAALPARPGATYALRVAAYGRADTLFALRVVRQHEDGGVTLLWKKLQKFKTPNQKQVKAAK